MTSIGDRALDAVKFLLALPAVAFTALLAALLFFNFGRVSESIDKLHRIVVPGVVELTFHGSDPEERAKVAMEWATYYRVSDMDVVGAKLDNDNSDKCPDDAEWIEVRAREGAIDLAGGYVGDSSEMRRLPSDGAFVPQGECLRIVTCGHVEEPGQCVSVVHVKTFDGTTSEAFLRKDVGEGDRIVVFDRRRRLVLDVDYWVTKATDAPDERSPNAIP